VKAELDQFSQGLDDAGVLETLQNHALQPFFVYNSTSLTAAQLVGLFEKKVFSQQGSTEYSKEQATYMLFKDLLDEMEGGAVVVEGDETVTLSLGDCLSFFTGAEQVPLSGFDGECTLNFNIYPTASTCRKK
jgi:hypothetical protein